MYMYYSKGMVRHYQVSNLPTIDEKVQRSDH